MTDWWRPLEAGAPDIVAAWEGIEAGERDEVRREVAARTVPGSAAGIVSQLATLTAATAGLVAGFQEADLRRPGGEEDWNVAQAVGHACDARAGMAIAASRAATGRWPADAPSVVPGIPGDADADRATLLARIERAQRVVERCATSIAGHETDPCPLDHPLVGRLRCGEWLIFAGVHDLMHLEQLHDLATRERIPT